MRRPKKCQPLGIPDPDIPGRIVWVVDKDAASADYTWAKKTGARSKSTEVACCEVRCRECGAVRGAPCVTLSNKKVRGGKKNAAVPTSVHYSRFVYRWSVAGIADVMAYDRVKAAIRALGERGLDVNWRQLRHE